MKDKIDFKLTQKRADILKVITDADRPVCAETIYWNLIEKKVSINMLTVYRGIDFLVKKRFDKET